MARQNAALLAFNRGIVGAQSLARVDLERMRLSAEEQTNWLPRALGSMSLRPGLQYIRATHNGLKAINIPFVYSAVTDMALLECTPGLLRPLVDEAPITRAAVSTTVTNGDFSSGTGWTITTVGGSTGSVTGGKLVMSCVPVDSYVTCARSVSVAAPDQAVGHAVRIIVDNGPVYFKIGSFSGGEDIMSMTQLGPGTHSLAFTPNAATIYIQFEAREPRQVSVDSIAVEAAGTLTLPAFWTADDLSMLRWDQSGDVVFIACYGKRRYRIERRAVRSWSIVTYQEVDGPFLAYTSDSSIKMSIDKARGNGTLTATRPYFKTGHIGALYRLYTPGYNFSYDLGQEDVFTKAVRVNGVGAARNVTLDITGTWAGTLAVQKSYTSEDSGFVDVTPTYTANGTATITDTADNVVVWVRVGFKTGGYTSGLATVKLSFGAGIGGIGRGGTATSIGGRIGVCRVTSVAGTGLTADVEILSDFSSSQRTLDWFEAEWSNLRGWPSAVGLHEGRLFWASRDRIVGSVPDAFNSYDPSVTGDSGPIQRSIGYGPVQVINFLLSLNRMIVGGQTSEIALRSSTFEEPLSPTNFTLKNVSTYGSGPIQAVRADTRGLFVDKSRQKLLEVAYSVEANDYITADMTRLCPDLFLNNPIQRIAIQRQPDTRVHCVRADGTVAVVVYEPLEDVRCWWVVETDGDVEDVVVLPDLVEDRVYYSVKRTINGVDIRYLERMAREDECVGGAVSKLADCCVVYQGAATTNVINVAHLEGKSVIVWADGKDISPLKDDGTQTLYTVSGGGFSIPVAASTIVYGLPYQARYKSTKLAYAAAGGTALTQRKRVPELGVVLHKSHHQGLRYGRDYAHLDNLPMIEDGRVPADGTIWPHYDESMFTFNGDWDTDARLCLVGQAPRPVTVLAAVIDVSTSG